MGTVHSMDEQQIHMKKHLDIPIFKSPFNHFLLDSHVFNTQPSTSVPLPLSFLPFLLPFVGLPSIAQKQATKQKEE